MPVCVSTSFTHALPRNKQQESLVRDSDPSEGGNCPGSDHVMFKNFTEEPARVAGPSSPPFAGLCLPGSFAAMDFICFYDWDECRVIRRLDVAVKNVIWSESGEMVTIVSDTSFFILRYNLEATAEAFASGQVDESEGVEESFELISEINESVVTGIWVGDCFIYTTADKS